MVTQAAPQTAATRARPMLTVVRELSADFETPASVYLKLANGKPSFLLESVTGGDQVARYSFIGVDLDHAFVLRNDALEQHSPNGVTQQSIPEGGDPFDALRQHMQQRQPNGNHDLPRFSGGLVGYTSYDIVRYFEPTVPLTPHPQLPEAIFLQADTLVAFDHAFGRILLIANVLEQDGAETAQAEANKQLDELEERLQAALPSLPKNTLEDEAAEFASNVEKEAFMRAVEQAKEHIAAGDIFQVVLSQRLSRQTQSDPFTVYRSLRRLNPSPYMFFFNFGELVNEEPMYVIGASPEMHVRLEGDTAALRPIAGTRPRGATFEEDKNLEVELLDDPKECAEHVMLVDLARNDLGRVCEYGSINVSDFMSIERYSHVMHIVSHVEGQLRPDYDAFDLLRATFPAGTVSGAPKIRAMQIIDDLETDPRGAYAGAVGYFSYDGSLDTCITIRTLVMQGQEISVQAGAGIVADSDPAREHEETLNKARALAEAVALAERGGK
ncbi:MAG: anthranilate synthase component I [Chloroflexi bacterium]|nr:MAG: anthranilate synthase component I [Chloroflexota bacterium]MBL1192725.1 anthranilate synthase component I [Chloroflexota bacterium]NOH10017.1 anthranilate synthase component I [Chloroflexota bacterium]